MPKILLITSIIFVVLFLLFAPFWHVGGHYYRGLLLIYDIRPASGGFIPAPDFVKEITWIKWADPTSFEYIGDNYAKDRFNVYSQYYLDGFDPKTFRQIQAPLTGEFFYVDKNNLRFYEILVLKAVSGNRNGDGKDIVTEKFDMESFQPLGSNVFKDKNGVYTYFRLASFTENMNQQGGYRDRSIELFKKQQSLDTETFKINFCNAEKTNCQASDKNSRYIVRRQGSSFLDVVIQPLE